MVFQGKMSEQPNVVETGHINGVVSQAAAVAAGESDPLRALVQLLALMGEFAEATSALVARHHRDTFSTTIEALYTAADASSAEYLLEQGESRAAFAAAYGRRDGMPLVWHADEPLATDGVAAHLEESAILTLICIPLWVRGRQVGHLEVWNTREKRPFVADELMQLSSVAQFVAMTLENVSLADKEAWHQREIDALRQIAQNLTGTLDLQKVMKRTVNAVRAYLADIDSCAISILECENTKLRTLAGWATENQFNLLPVGEIVPVAEAYAAEVALATKRPFVISDLNLHPFTNDWMRQMQQKGVAALLSVPLLAGDVPSGVMQVYIWRQPRQFTEEELSICQGIANQAALAIENARLYEAEKRQLRLSQTLQKVGALLTGSLPIDELYERIFDLLAQVVTYDSVSVHLLDKLNNRLRLEAIRGDIDVNDAEYVIPENAAQLLARVKSGPHWAIIGDTKKDPRWLQMSDSRIRSWIGAALIVKGKLIGILNIDSHQSNLYTKATAEMVAAFANQAAVAIENARLHQEITQQAEELKILHEVAVATAAEMEVDELLQKTTHLIASKLYPHSFGFILLDFAGKKMMPHQSYHGITSEKQLEPVPLDRSVTGNVVCKGTPIVVADVRQESAYYEGTPHMLSEVCVPLKVQQKVIGVINAESPQLDAFSQRDVHFLTTLAGQVATAVERAKLYNAVRQQADDLVLKVAERTDQLRAERDRTLAILESAGEGILLTDTDARIIFVNRAMETQTGFRRDELMGQRPSLFSSGQTTQETYEALWSRISGGKIWSGELVNRRKDGTLYDVSLTISPLRDHKTDEITGFVSVQSDITRLKELDRLKSEFVSNVTHELRTPLTNLKTYLSLLERGRVEKRPYYLQVLNDETDRLTHLIQNLLDLSRLEMATKRVERVAADLPRKLQTALEHLHDSVAEKQIDLTQSVPADLPPVFTTDVHLEQVLTHLLANALTYTPPGGKVAISAGRTADSVWLSVVDTGPGIPEAEVPHIFERFFRGQVTRDQNVPGTGLGLSIIQAILERYGGSIAVQSEPGNGACFTIHLRPAAEPTSA